MIGERNCSTTESDRGMSWMEVYSRNMEVKLHRPRTTSIPQLQHRREFRYNLSDAQKSMQAQLRFGLQVQHSNLLWVLFNIEKKQSLQLIKHIDKYKHVQTIWAIHKQTCDRPYITSHQT